MGFVDDECIRVGQPHGLQQAKVGVDLRAPLKNLPLANYFYDLRQNFMAKPWLLLKLQAKA
jgi:hypothetical protein